MGTYASLSELKGRLAYRAQHITDTSEPNNTDINLWINEAEAALTAAIAAGQGTTPITNANGILLMKQWALMYVEGRTRMAFASAGGDGDNDDGKDLIEKFEDLIDKILDNPSRYDAMLSGGDAAETTRHLRGHVLDNQDNKSVANGDYLPEWTKEAQEEQF